MPRRLLLSSPLRLLPLFAGPLLLLSVESIAQEVLPALIMVPDEALSGGLPLECQVLAHSCQCHEFLCVQVGGGQVFKLLMV